MGGCYDARAAPGSDVCREARDGTCVGYVEEDKTDRTSAGVIRAGAGDTCPKVDNDSSQETGKCKKTKCDVMIGGSQYCSECSVITEFPINGVCTTEKDNNAGCTAVGKCTSCGDGYFLHKGGCYKKGQQPGQAICKDTADITGKCQVCASGYFSNPAATDNAKESCIACGDAAGADHNKGVLNCKTCTKPGTSGTSSTPQTATCTACEDGYFVKDDSTKTCEACGDKNCATCAAAGKNQCSKCKATNTAGAKLYLKTEYSSPTGTCVTEADCTNGNYIDEAAKTCSTCASAGTTDCSTCEKGADGAVVCKTCTTGEKTIFGLNKKSCVAKCPTNSQAGTDSICKCNDGFTPSIDSTACVAASSSVNLSTGAIAGISVAVVVVVGGLVGFLCWWFICRGKA